MKGDREEQEKGNGQEMSKNKLANKNAFIHKPITAQSRTNESKTPMPG